MKTPSLKNVSTSDVEAAIALALAKLTGWENCAVSVEALEFGPDQGLSGERASLRLTARFTPAPGEPLPF